MTKTKFIISFTLVILFIAFLSRCTKDVGKIPVASNINCDTITYDKHIKPIMANNCISCHGDPLSGGAPVYMNTYSSVKTSADNGSLKRTTIDEASMPLGGPPLSKSDQDLISCWVSTGVKENITYTDHIKPIIDKNCVSCHGYPLSGGAPFGLESYADVKAIADNGTLKKTVIVDGTMPQGGPPLSQTDKDRITFWLNNGKAE